MLTPKLVLLLLGTASAVPAPDKAISGPPTLLSTAPHAATATLSTKRPGGYPTTSSSAPTQSADSFAACHNKAGPFKPFCLPRHQETYYPDSTHYITWDPSFFASPNTTIKLIGFYSLDDPATTHTATSNTTLPADSRHQQPQNQTKQPDQHQQHHHQPPQEEEEAFSSDSLPSGWGFYQWRPAQTLLSSKSLRAANITLRMVSLPPDGGHAQWHEGPTVRLALQQQQQPGPPPPPPSSSPPPQKKKKNKHKPTADTDAAALLVALPLVFGFAALMIAGTYHWNRRVRQIDVGSVMGRGGRARGGSARKKAGYAGVGRRERGSARDDRDKEQSIRLMDRDALGGGSGGGSDSEEDGAGADGWRRAGRDAHGLGTLPAPRRGKED